MPATHDGRAHPCLYCCLGPRFSEEPIGMRRLRSFPSHCPRRRNRITMKPVLSSSRRVNFGRLGSSILPPHKHGRAPLLKHRGRFLPSITSLVRLQNWASLLWELKGQDKRRSDTSIQKSQTRVATPRLGPSSFRGSERIRVSARSTAITSLRLLNFAQWNAVSPTYIECRHNRVCCKIPSESEASVVESAEPRGGPSYGHYAPYQLLEGRLRGLRGEGTLWQRDSVPLPGEAQSLSTVASEARGWLQLRAMATSNTSSSMQNNVSFPVSGAHRFLGCFQIRPCNYERSHCLDMAFLGCGEEG